MNSTMKNAAPQRWQCEQFGVALGKNGNVNRDATALAEVTAEVISYVRGAVAGLPATCAWNLTFEDLVLIVSDFGLDVQPVHRDYKKIAWTQALSKLKIDRLASSSTSRKAETNKRPNHEEGTESATRRKTEEEKI